MDKFITMNIVFSIGMHFRHIEQWTHIPIRYKFQNNFQWRFQHPQEITGINSQHK